MRKTLIQVAAGVTCVIAMSSVLTYRLMFEEMEQRASEHLSRYVIERGHAEGAHFALARDLQHVIRQAVIQAYPSYLDAGTLERFDTLFVRYPDDSVRSRPELFRHYDSVTAWIRRGTLLTPELRQRTVLFADILEQFKATSRLRFGDIYFAGPEQVNIGTDLPEVPFWAKKVHADHDDQGTPAAVMVRADQNPTRDTVWSRVTMDRVWGRLLVTVGTPIDIDGRHVGSVFNEILLDELVGNLLRAGMPGAKHCIFQSEGYLIAHTDRMPEIIAARGKYSIQSSQDGALLALGRAVAGHPELPISGYDESSDQYFAMSRIDGPGWYLASTISGEVMRTHAFHAVRWILWAGFASLSVLLLVLGIILRRQMVVPLHRLNLAVENMASGGMDESFRDLPRDEIGRLAMAFGDMAQKVAVRDTALRQEKRGLEQALLELRNTEHRWRALIEHASDAIVVLDAHLLSQYVSPAFESMLGHVTGARIGVPLWQCAHAEDKDELERQMEDTLRATTGERPRVLRYRARHEDGSYRHLEGLCRNQLGEPAVNGIVVNLRDITEKVQADEALQRQRESLYQRDRLAAMGSLLAGVAHELNNPLSVVVGRSIMLEEASADALTRAATRKIRTAAERCARIVRTFLSMARQHAQTMGRVHIEDVIDSALDVVDYSLRTSDVEVMRDYARDLPELYADADQLHQVSMNLLVNAQQSMAECSGVRRLEISTRRAPDPHNLVVIVSDSGSGIAPEIRSRIFDPYFTTKPMGTGTGVGLSISLGIVEAHHGSLVQQSPASGGARFVVTLPCADAGGEPRAHPVPAHDTAPQLTRRRVLVIDDDEDVRETLRDILLRAQHLPDVCAGGVEAMTQRSLEQYDVIISDLRMQVMDGPALYREIEAHWPELVSRLIFISGDNLSADLRRFLGEVKRPLIGKPFTPASVEFAIARL